MMVLESKRLCFTSVQNYWKNYYFSQNPRPDKSKGLSTESCAAVCDWRLTV
jgi:hypothetical protein